MSKHEHDFGKFTLKFHGGLMRTVAVCEDCGQEVGRETPMKISGIGVKAGESRTLMADDDCPIGVVKEVLES